MESSRPRADDPHAALSLADDARRRLTAGLRLPAGALPVLGAAVAVQIGAGAYGIAAQTLAGLGVVLGGLAVFLAAAASLLHRFRRAHGVRVDGLAAQVVLAAGGAASIGYPAAFAAATWAAFAQVWWLVALAAVLGGAACALGTRRWWRAYQHDPAAHSRGASPRVLALLAVIAALGFVVLAVLGR